MFRRNTVFIVGAGASKELGLPTGAELSASISELCDIRLDDWGKPENASTSQMLESMKWAGEGDEDRVVGWMRSLDAIRAALPYKDSIDAVIDQFYDQDDVAEIGKFMIAKLVLEAENTSSLRTSQGQAGPNLRRLKDTWLSTLGRMLFEGLRKQDLGEIGANVSIVCFNYDRCIELYLALAIAENYGVSSEEAFEAASRVRIVHAYGSLGWLPEWPTATPQLQVPFGGQGENPWIVSHNLRTFSESVDSATDETIKEIVGEGEQYVYLGLSFGRQNMELLGANSRMGRVVERDAFASGLGQHEQGRKAISQLIQRTYSSPLPITSPTAGPHPRTRLELGTTAKQLLDLHWHNILG